MRKTFYLPKADADRVTWLKNFAAKLPTYTAKFSLDAVEVQNIAMAANFFADLIAFQATMDDFRKSLTEYKRGMMADAGARTLPVLPAIPANMQQPPAPGILAHISALVGRIKNANGYTEQDGKDLGIEGTEQQQTPEGETKPTISLRPATDGHVELVWKKYDASAIEFEVSTDNGATWAFLAKDTAPNYTDTTTVTAPQKRSYRAIYHDGDGRVGQWSDVVSMMAG